MTSEPAKGCRAGVPHRCDAASSAASLENRQARGRRPAASASRNSDGIRAGSRSGRGPSLSRRPQSTMRAGARRRRSSPARGAQRHSRHRRARRVPGASRRRSRRRTLRGMHAGPHAHRRGDLPLAAPRVDAFRQRSRACRRACRVVGAPLGKADDDQRSVDGEPVDDAAVLRGRPHDPPEKRRDERRQAHGVGLSARAVESRMSTNGEPPPGGGFGAGPRSRLR